jgi:hypothetical protein
VTTSYAPHDHRSHALRVAMFTTLWSVRDNLVTAYCHKLVPTLIVLYGIINMKICSIHSHVVGGHLEMLAGDNPSPPPSRPAPAVQPPARSMRSNHSVASAPGGNGHNQLIETEIGWVDLATGIPIPGYDYRVPPPFAEAVQGINFSDKSMCHSLQ